MKEISRLSGQENLNTHVHVHAQGGANPGFITSRVCPNRLYFANFIFEFIMSELVV